MFFEGSGFSSSNNLSLAPQTGEKDADYSWFLGRCSLSRVGLAKAQAQAMGLVDLLYLTDLSRIYRVGIRYKQRSIYG